MKRPLVGILPAIAVILLAACFRLPDLGNRTMHGDEAVHAVKFGELLEHGSYRYDPIEYHGPTLNYLTLIPAWLTAKVALVDVTESMLRLVPALCGILLVLLLFLLVDGLGRPAVLIAAILTAISPSMVFYSRYYIQEMLLVFFTLGMIVACFRYSRSRRAVWALTAGICLGLMHGTKETFVIPVFAALLACAMVTFMQKRTRRPSSSLATWILIKHIGICVGAYLITAILFYSSFFSHPAGLGDALATYTTYLDRATSSDLHLHPWHYYIGLLVYFQIGEGSVWTEAIILVLALAGAAAAWHKDRLPGVSPDLLRFLVVYTLIQGIIFSLIPYKTPWNLLLFFQGAIMLAGVGAVFLLTIINTHLLQGLLALLIIGAGSHLGIQGYRGSFVDYDNSTNPYVYAHPVSDVKRMARRAVELARVHPMGLDMTIQVISPEHDYWPLPWYLRQFTQVGYWNRVDDKIVFAPLILAAPAVENRLIDRLYSGHGPGEFELYVPAFDQELRLRPGVSLRGYVRKGLWDRFQNQALQAPE